MTTPTPWSAKPKPVKPKKPAAPQEGNPNAQAGRTWSRKGRSSPRHSNTVRRVLRVGQMAWEGRRAGEIADEIGVGTQYVYQLCSDYRIALAKKTRAEYAMRVTLPLRTIAKLERIAAERDEPLQDLLTRALDALSQEPVLLANLIEEDEDEPQPRRRPRKKTEPLSTMTRKPKIDDWRRLPRSFAD